MQRRVQISHSSGMEWRSQIQCNFALEDITEDVRVVNQTTGTFFALDDSRERACQIRITSPGLPHQPVCSRIYLDYYK